MGKFSNLFEDRSISSPVIGSSSTGKFNGLFNRPQEKPPAPKQPNAIIKHLTELPAQIAKTPGVSLLKKAFSPETMKRGFDVSGVGDIPAITQDIASIPSRLAGFPTIPLQSKLATEAIPRLAEEIFEPRGEFQVPTFTPKNIPRLFTGKSLLKNPVRPSIADVTILGSFARSGIRDIGQRQQFNRGLAKELAKPIIEAEILQARRRAGVEPWPAGKAPIETTARTVSPEPKTQGLKLLPDTTTKPKPSIQPVAGGKPFTGKLALKPGEDISGVSVVQTTSPAQIKDVSGKKLNFGANDSIYAYPIISQSTGKFTGKVMVKDGDKGIVSLPKDLTPEEAKLKIEEKITGSKPRAELPEEAQIEEVVKVNETKKYTINDVEYQGIEDNDGVKFHILKVPDNVLQLPVTQYPTRTSAIERALQKTQGYDKTKFSQYQLPGGENYREIILSAGDLPGGQSFTSTHFPDVKNPIAHIRVSDRTTPDGKKIFFIEEIQGDWAKEGRAKGFAPEKALTREEYFKSGNIVKSYDGYDKVIAYHPPIENAPYPKNYWSVDVIGVKADGSPKTGEKIRNHSTEPDLSIKGVPSHPLLKNWQELTLKRLLKKAVDEGYDGISWTTGEQQAERYDLAKHINSIQWYKSNDGKYKYIRIEPKDAGLIRVKINEKGIVSEDESRSFADVETKKLYGKNISDVIGKDISEKILKKDEDTVSGEGLKLGGEWAKNLYDKQIPNILKDLTKREVGDIEIRQGKPGIYGGKMLPKSTQPYLEITPAIRARITGQPIGGGLPIEKRQAAMQERIMNVAMAKDRIAEINNVRKRFLRGIRKYKKGYLKEELAGLPAKYVTVSGGITPDEALQDLRDNYGVDLRDESALKDYFIGLDKEINELKGIIATNKPKIVARSEATILRREQKITESLQKKFSGQAKKIIQEVAKTSARLERKAFKAGKATEAERRKTAYFGPQRSKEERSKLYLLAKEKGLYYTDFKGKPHDKLAGILKYYPEASFDQLREYISSLTGDPQNPPKLFKLHGDIAKDTEVIKLLNQVSDNWQDINKMEIHSLDPARIVEKVTQQDLWDDNILADNTFNVYAAADEAKYDRLTRENADLIANKMGIKRGSKESSELMRKFEAGEPLTEKEKLVATYLRRKYDAFIAEANEMRLRLGKKLIPYRRDYMTHILEQNLLSDFFKGDTDRMGDISSEQLDAIRKGDYTKGNMPFNRFALRRKGKKTKYDAIGNYEIYLKTILNEIYFTPAITHARKFIEYALVKQPNAYKALDRLANDLKGKPSIEDQNVIGRIASFGPIKRLRSLQAKSALLGNINFWLMNSSNFAISYDELGNYMNKGLAKFIGNKKWRDFAFKHSDMLKGRTIDPDIEPSSFKFVEEAAGYVTNLLEYNNVGSTFVGAYFKGIDLGYPQAKAIKYADSIARRTQVGYKKFELNAWMRSNSGMLLSQFQSWTFNAMNHILYDLGVANLPRNLLGKFTGQKPRPIKYKKLLTLVAIGMLLNLLYKKSRLREPYTPESAMPRIPGLGGSVPPVVRIGQNIGTAFTGKKPETRQKAAMRAGLSFVPGGTQLGRIFTGKLLPVKKDTEIKTIPQPKISSKFGGSKFKTGVKFKKRF